jgi:hypothetical protein
MTYVFAVVGADFANLAVKHSIERRSQLRQDNENFEDRITTKLELFWTQTQDFNYLKNKKIKIYILDAIRMFAVKRNEMNPI